MIPLNHDAPMIPLTLQAWIGVGIAGCLAGIYELRAEVRAIHVPRLPAKYRRRSRGRHHARRGEESTMQRLARIARQAQAQAQRVEPDWMADLRATWSFGDVDEFDYREVGGAATYDRLPWVLDGPITQGFRRLVGSEWGTPVDVDEWAEPQLAVSRG